MSTKIILENVRLSFCNLFSPRAISEGSEPKYSVCALISKKDKELLKKIQLAISSEIAVKWGTKVPLKLKTPLKDGDIEASESCGPEFEGCMFLNCNSLRKPQVALRNGSAAIDDESIYSGCWADVYVTFYSYSKEVNKGISCSLNGVQKIKDDESFAGSLKIEFKTIEAEDEDI